MNKIGREAAEWNDDRSVFVFVEDMYKVQDKANMTGEFLIRINLRGPLGFCPVTSAKEPCDSLPNTPLGLMKHSPFDSDEESLVESLYDSSIQESPYSWDKSTKRSTFGQSETKIRRDPLNHTNRFKFTAAEDKLLQDLVMPLIAGDSRKLFDKTTVSLQIWKRL